MKKYSESHIAHRKNIILTTIYYGNSVHYYYYYFINKILKYLKCKKSSSVHIILDILNKLFVKIIICYSNIKLIVSVEFLFFIINLGKRTCIS